MAGTIKRLRSAIDPNGNPVEDCQEVSGYIDNMVLAATTKEDYTIPADAKLVRITCTTGIWVNFNGDAAIPATEIATGLGCIYIPSERFFAIPTGAETISFIAAANSVVSLEIFK